MSVLHPPVWSDLQLGSAAERIEIYRAWAAYYGAVSQACGGGNNSGAFARVGAAPPRAIRSLDCSDGEEQQRRGGAICVNCGVGGCFVGTGETDASHEKLEEVVSGGSRAELPGASGVLGGSVLPGVDGHERARQFGNDCDGGRSVGAKGLGRLRDVDHADVQEASSLRKSDDVVENHGARGKNWERNKKNRDAQKDRKLRRKQMGNDWRHSQSARNSSVSVGGPGFESWLNGETSAGVEPEVESVEPSTFEVKTRKPEGFKEGFFVECSSDVRRQLRESRAAVLIAENKRREFEEKKKLERLQKQQDPVVELVGEMIRITRMTEQLKKQTKDSKISGWAETIADSLSKSTASSGPSSVPSVESVQKESALRSEGDCVEFDQDREVRLMNYNLRKVQLDRHFDALDGYGIEEHDRAYSMLKDEFSDVAKTEAERQSEIAVKRIADSLQQAGFDQYAIQDIIEKAGYEYDA